jgi:hypothetical protein
MQIAVNVLAKTNFLTAPAAGFVAVRRGGAHDFFVSTS